VEVGTVQVGTVQVDTALVDEVVARFAARGGQPGLAFGVVAGGELVHSGGTGERFAGGPPPDAATVFRIASMTKSFTASVIMLLRERGELRLDDPAREYVPELAGVRLPASDCPPVTIRHLLTMTAGFPTDDPWGDRQQGLALPAFGQLLADGGVRLAWAPGTRFEYSNLGYAILGRVIAAITGASYESAVRDNLLAVLGMTRTGFEAGEFEASELTLGYVRRDGGWQPIEPDPSGAFAPMGGIFSCVADLARWAAGFAVAFPARDAPDDAHPLSRASRREMQLPHVAVGGGLDAPAARLAGPAAVSYGLGLFAENDPVHGTIVQHSGGYPGYGSHMRWHPATGLAAIVLANSTYAAAGALAGEMLAAILQDEVRGRSGSNGPVTSGPVPDPGGPWPETLAAMEAVNGLLAEWDDAAATHLFTANVGLDQPWAERRADIEALRERIGAFRPDPARAVECDSPAHCRWWVTGERGTARVQIRLAPLRAQRVQQLIVAVPPPPASVLGNALTELLGALNSGAQDWPASLTSAASTGHVLRQLRIAAAWAGPCELTSYLAGDGASSVTVELTGRDGRASLTVEFDADSRRLQQADVALLPAL
jgi:CubicO group peptidase (beta-lactamase class C family)